MNTNTNFYQLHHDLALQKDECLFLMHHAGEDFTLQKILSNPACYKAKHIYLIDSEQLVIDEELKLFEIDERVHLWTSGVNTHPRLHTHQWWFNWMQEIELYNNFVSRIEPSRKKPYVFEAMLGTPRDHKNFVREKIDESPHKNKFLLGGRGNTLIGTDNWIPGVHEEITDESGDKYVLYNKVQKTPVSNVVPYFLYNSSWFSCVAETRYDRIFSTEKIGKPLLGKRMFVLFSAQYHLEHLKDIGFKTFDSIIDESYDKIKDHQARFLQAWQQIEYLLTQPAETIAKLIEPIVEHNHEIFMQTNWQKPMYEKIQNISRSSK